METGVDIPPASAHGVLVQRDRTGNQAGHPAPTCTTLWLRWRLGSGSGKGISRPTTFPLKDLKTKFKKYEVVNCLQCAGNRREDFHGNVNGDQQIFISPHWIVGAFSNAKWGGARMRDVLSYCGLDVDSMYLGKIDPHDMGIKHVQFEAYDATETGMTYGASVPIDKVVDAKGDCLVAYEMNGVPIPPDHGKPVRALIAGHFGCRNCKWLHKITLSDQESGKPWQNKSYLGFAPDVRFEADPEVSPGKAAMRTETVFSELTR